MPRTLPQDVYSASEVTTLIKMAFVMRLPHPIAILVSTLLYKKNILFNSTHMPNFMRAWEQAVVSASPALLQLWLIQFF